MLNEFVLFETNIVPFLIDNFWLILFIIVMAIDRRLRIGAVFMLAWQLIMYDDRYHWLAWVAMFVVIFIHIYMDPLLRHYCDNKSKPKRKDTQQARTKKYRDE